MEFIKAHQERYQQIAKLHQHLPELYIDLQIKYETQQQEILHQKEEIIEYKCKANYWETQFSTLKSREESLRLEMEELKAVLKKRERQLFGKRSEKSVRKLNEATLNQRQPEPKKKRGQQEGAKGHGRRDYSQLPTVEEVVSIVDAHCPCCKLPYQELSSTEDSEIIDMIDVKAYRRCIYRKNYKRRCQCPQNADPQLISAPVTEKLIPKSKLGVSIWAHILLQKYEYQQPLNRTLEQLSHYGLALSSGTMTDGLQRLLPLFIPVFDAIVERSLLAQHWHADETGWKVFEKLEGKNNHRWYLWIFHNTQTVVYKMSPTRSSQVLVDHFGKDHRGGTLNVDRYSAYKAIAKAGLFILAFCWAHVRRDFLEHAKGYPHCEDWGLAWVERIGHLYHLNNQRLAHHEKSKRFKEHQAALKKAVDVMQEEIKQQREDKSLLPSQTKLLKSLEAHWEGLTLFVDRPDIPMDNNLAERGLRSSVVGRKNYYGSGSVWSANLAAAMLTIFKTVKLHGVNPHTWLLAYLHECAMHGGVPPDNIMHYLPWNMPPELKTRFSEPPKHEGH